MEMQAKSRRAVRRVYVRHNSLNEDLFVPTGEATTVGELRIEATKRLQTLGVDLADGLKDLHRKRGEAIPDSVLIDEALKDGEVVEAYSAGSSRGSIKDHVLVQHPALRDKVSLWVPADSCTTVDDLIHEAQSILRRTGDNRLCISELVVQSSGEVLPRERRWKELIESGELLRATHGDGPTIASSAGQAKDPTIFKVRHRLDSSVWSQEMVSQGLEGLEIKAKDVKNMSLNTSINLTTLSTTDDIDVRECEIYSEHDQSSSASDTTTCSPRESPTKRLSSSYGLLLHSPRPAVKSNNPVGLSSPGTLQVLSMDSHLSADMLENEDDVLKRMPGGSWAVFRGERKSSSPSQK